MNKIDIKNKILSIIKENDSITGSDFRDYLKEVRAFYDTLNIDEKSLFNDAILSILDDEYFLELIVYFCNEFSVISSCPKLFQLFLNPPNFFKENGYQIDKDRLRGSIADVLIEFGYKDAINHFIALVKNMTSGSDNSDPNLSLPSYWGLIKKLSTKNYIRTQDFFGWWIKKAQIVDLEEMEIVEHLNEKPETINRIRQDHLRRGALVGAGNVRKTIYEVCQKQGYDGLKEWLKGVILINKRDREYLKNQIAVSLTKEDCFYQMREIIDSKVTNEQIIQELSILPQYKDPLSAAN